MSTPRRAGSERKKAAFAMVDILASFFITVVLMLSCCSLLIGSRRLSQQSQIQSAAYQAARQELETLRSLKFGNRPATAKTAFTIPSTVSSEFPSQRLIGYYSVQAFGSSTPPVQQIIVKVTWSRLGVHTPVTSYVQLDGLAVQEPGE